MRRQILNLRRQRPRLVGELVEALGIISKPGISKYLRVLRQVRLVGVRRDARRRWYELRPESLQRAQWKFLAPPGECLPQTEIT